MEQQVSQRSIKKYMVLFPVLALVVCFVILKGADMESVWNAMKSAKPQWLAAGLYWRRYSISRKHQSEERIEFIWISGKFQTGYEICLCRLFFQFDHPICNRRTAGTVICDE